MQKGISILLVYFVVTLLNVIACELDYYPFKNNIVVADSIPITYCPPHFNETKYQKKCNLRQYTYKLKWWNMAASGFCYNYTNDDRFKSKRKLKGVLWPVICGEEKTYFLIAPVDGNKILIFDHTNETSRSYVRETFKTEEYFQKWVQCSRESVHCCVDVQNEDNIDMSGKGYCSAMWDAWTCWQPAEAGTVAKAECSNEVYSSSSPGCVAYSEKTCFDNVTWNQQTDYGPCTSSQIYPKRHHFHVIVLAVAIAFALPAIIIFSAFHKFRHLTRVILHRNLLIAIVLRNILTIMSKELIILDQLAPKETTCNRMLNNSVACRVLAFFEGTSKNAIYASMLVDGFYLHKVIVRSFANEPKLPYLYAVVAVLSLLPSFIWAGLITYRNNNNCWMADSTGSQWVQDAFRIAVISINTLLLVHIIVSILMKVKNISSKQSKATLKVTVFLIPLFGLHMIIIANRNIINSNKCYAEDIYYYVSYSMEALQGLMVALLFCYINNEVHGEIKNGYRKFTLYLEQRFGFQIRRPTINRRRTTAATYCEGY